METWARTARHADMRTKKKRWKRECGLHAKSTCGPGDKDGNACGSLAASTRGPGKKDGNACAECLSRRQRAQEKKRRNQINVNKANFLLTKNLLETHQNLTRSLPTINLLTGICQTPTRHLPNLADVFVDLFRICQTSTKKTNKDLPQRSELSLIVSFGIEGKMCEKK